ncbi:inactive serine/threonine-protein kinase PLK5 isoform X1 [Malaclemys terrapin pileata]|uniref:inactive serine/threonine-protein kinase PLK5 isoform X1 n=1 Tax=Malaclemys terrapin pileata TaxID=2991368 RepID=UPI0023A7C49B|nr:inactive serine/threonine-protein kinase PLK5 isoform X1 [Malaclemys terrapin pileata]
MGKMEHSASRRAQGDNLSYFLEDPGTGTLYRRGQLLGKGAFGRCYKFTDTSTGKVYAIKIVPQSRISRLESRGKVEREIELHSHLSHRHVVGFHRHFADRDNIYMILEYCSHKSLAHILKARKTLTEPEVRYYLRQIIAGLRYLHQQGIIHRDLKLSNFFLTKNMQVKIGDLGLATRDEQAGRRRGVVCGTPNYLAPEVIAKKGHSFQSDIWALGCIMYTALTGCSPFEITHKQEMYQCIREGRYPIPNHLSPGARKLIGCLLAPSPSERPSLEEVLEHEFFTQGFTPDKLPSRACHSVPVFALPNPIGKLLKKAAKVLFRGLPCQEPRAGSPVPGEEPEKLMSRSQQAQNLPSLEQHSEVERGSVQAAPFPEAPSMFSIHLLMTGALRPSRSGANSDAGWSVASAVQSVTRVLGSCLENMPLAEHNPMQRLALPVLWVTRWVDYSNKYGFGYLLSDGSTGALLADGTHLALCPQSLRVCYCPGCGEAVSFPRSDVPTSLATKMDVLHFFSQYMQQKLLEGGNEPAGPSSSTDAPCLLCCAKSDRALLMLFSNGTLQVNFYHDHTKLVLGCPGGGHLLTFIDEQRVSATFPLGALATEGCAPALRERLQYTLDMAHCL